MGKRTRALRWRMLFWLLPLTLVLGPLVAVYAYQTAAAPLNAQVDGTLSALARVIAQAVERSVNGWVDATASLADSRQTREAMAELRSSYRSIVQEMAPTLSEPTWARMGGELRTRYERDLVKALGQTRAGTALPEIGGWMPGREGLILQTIYSREVRRETLLTSSDTLQLSFAKTRYAEVLERNEPVWKLYAERNAFADILFADADGTVLYSLRRSAILGQALLSPAHRTSAPAQALRAALLLGADTGHPAVTSDAAPSEWDGDEPSLWVGSAVTDDTGRRVGVLLSRISLVNELDPILSFHGAESEVGLGTTGTAMIIGADGKARSNFRFTAEVPQKSRRALTGGGQTTALRFDLSENAAARRLLRKDNRSGESGLVDAIGYRGQEVRAAYAPLRLPDLPWGLIVSQDRAESLAAATTLARNLGIGTALAMLALTLYAFLATHSISAPLADLAAVADAVTAGQEVRAKVKRNDEVGRVGAAMNRMLDTQAANRLARERELREMQAGFADISRVAAALGQGDLRERANIREGQLAPMGGQLDEAVGRLSETLSNLFAFTEVVQREARGAQELQTRLLDDVSRCGTSSMRSHGYTSEARAAMERVVIVGSATALQMRGEVSTAMSESLEASQTVETGLNQIAGGCRDVARKLQSISERAMAHDSVVREFETILSTLRSVGLNLNFALNGVPAETQQQLAGLRENLTSLTRSVSESTERLKRDFSPLLRDIAVAGESAEAQAEYISNHALSVQLTCTRLSAMAGQVEQAAESMHQLDQLAQQTDEKLRSAAEESHHAAGLAEESGGRALATQRAVEVLSSNADALHADAARFQLPHPHNSPRRS